MGGKGILNIALAPVTGGASLFTPQVGLTTEGKVAIPGQEDAPLPLTGGGGREGAAAGANLTEEQEDRARELESEAERRRRRRARMRRIFTGPQGALVGQANLGRARLFGQ